MRYFHLSISYSPGGKLNLLIMGAIIAAILGIISFATIQTSYAAGWSATGMFNPAKGKSPDGFHHRISDIFVSLIHDGDGGLRSSSTFFHQRGLKAYRYHHERYEILKKIMGWIMIPIFYILNHARVSLFFVACITILLVILDEFIKRHKENRDSSEKLTLEIETFQIEAFQKTKFDHTLAENLYSYKPSISKDVIHGSGR